MDIKLTLFGQTDSQFRVIHTPPDSSCLFHSICYSVYGNNFYSDQVREEIVNYVSTNWAQFQILTHDVKGDNYISPEHYRREMLKPSTYGSACELIAPSEIFHCIFRVYNDGHLLQSFGVEGTASDRINSNGAKPAGLAIMASLSMVTMVTLAAVISVGKGQNANKCDPNFTNKIESIIWKEFGKPSHILDDGSRAGKEFIILTTEGYYKEGASCIYTEFGNDGKTVKLITVSGSVTSTPDDDPLEEHNGVVEETDTHIRRVHIYSKDGIVVWYKCRNNGKDGELEVAMKVKHGSYNKEKVDNVKNLIHDKLGITFTKSYPHVCDQTSKDASKGSKEN